MNIITTLLLLVTISWFLLLAIYLELHFDSKVSLFCGNDQVKYITPSTVHEHAWNTFNSFL